MARALTLSGSVRAGSHNQKLQYFVGKKLEAAGFEVVQGDLGAFDLPIFNADLEPDHVPADAEKLAELMRSADVIFIATPEYNGGLPPILVNAITWVSRSRPVPFRGRLWGIGGVSTGKYGAIFALNHLRDGLTKMGALMVPGLLGVGPAASVFDEDDMLIDEAALRKVDQMIADFTAITLDK